MSTTYNLLNAVTPNMVNHSNSDYVSVTAVDDATGLKNLAFARTEAINGKSTFTAIQDGAYAEVYPSADATSFHNLGNHILVVQSKPFSENTGVGETSVQLTVPEKVTGEITEGADPDGHIRFVVSVKHKEHADPEQISRGLHTLANLFNNVLDSTDTNVSVIRDAIYYKRLPV